MAFGLAQLGLVLLAAPANAAYEVQCATPADLIAETRVCTDNALVLQRAQECKNMLDKAFAAAGPELAKIYDSEKSKYVLHQKHEMHYTNLDYQAAQAKLTHLIDEGRYNLDLIGGYAPVLFDIDEEDSVDPEFHEPCFTDNYEPLKEIFYQVDDQIFQLMQAKAAADALQAVASTNDGNIENLKAKLAGALRSVGAGSSQNGASDVTGTREAKAKEGALADPGVTAKVAKPELPSADGRVDGGKENARAGAAQAASAVTVPGNGGAARGPEPAAFSGRLGDNSYTEAVKASAAKAAPRGVSGNAPAITSSEAAQRNDASVGALLWKSSGTGGEALVLEPGAAAEAPKAAAGNPSSAGAPALAGAGFAEGGAGEARTVAPLYELTDTPGVSRAETDLFRAVHDRYRETELFRRARVIKVPLGSFEPGLKNGP